MRYNDLRADLIPKAAAAKAAPYWVAFGIQGSRMLFDCVDGSKSSLNRSMKCVSTSPVANAWWLARVFKKPIFVGNPAIWFTGKQNRAFSECRNSSQVKSVVELSFQFLKEFKNLACKVARKDWPEILSMSRLILSKRKNDHDPKLQAWLSWGHRRRSPRPPSLPQFPLSLKAHEKFN
jgi:hypothetical protein